MASQWTFQHAGDMNDFSLNGFICNHVINIIKLCFILWELK